MRRRELLRRSALTAGALAGCTSLPDPPTGASSSFSITRSGRIHVGKRTQSFADVYPEDKPVVEIVVGTRPANVENPHGVRIFNEYDRARDLHLTLRTGDDSIVFEGEGTVQPGAYVAVAIWTPDRYTVALEASGQQQELWRQFEVPKNAWSGRSAQHNVYVREKRIEVSYVGAG